MSRCQSFSSIKAFKQCKLKYYFRYIEKRKPEFKSPALLKGSKIHNQIAKALPESEEAKFGLHFRKKYSKFYRDFQGSPLYFDKEERPFFELIETRFGVDKNFESCSFNSKEAYFRGITDYIKIFVKKESIKKDEAFFSDMIKKVELYDWKTGSTWADKKQLECYSLFLFNLFPGLEKVTCKIVYVTPLEETHKYYDNDKYSQEVEGKRFYLPESWSVSYKQYGDIKEGIQKEIEKIEGCQDFNPCKTPLCSWCEYPEACQAFKEGPSEILLSHKWEGLKLE